MRTEFTLKLVPFVRHTSHRPKRRRYENGCRCREVGRFLVNVPNAVSGQLVHFFRMLAAAESSDYTRTESLAFAIGAPMSDVTRILSAIEQGDSHAAEELLPLVYDELRKLAAQKMANESPGQTLQATALVHDAYLRLVDVEKAQHWNSRGHFFAAAAEAMRRILVERARQKLGPKRGGGRARVDLEEALDVFDPSAHEILDVDSALEALARDSPIKAELVKLRYFCGLSHQEAAESLGLSRATADRYWAYAKAFLFAALQDEPG